MSADDIEHQLITYIASSTTARQILSQLHAIELAPIDIQKALTSVLELDGSELTHLLGRKLTTEQIVEALRSFNFKIYHPEILAEIELDEGIIPDGTARLLTEKTVKVKGEVWTVHKNDADPWPSNPHAHNYESGLKLHLGTGEIFDQNRIKLGKIGKKKLKDVRKKLGTISLPPLSKN